MKRAARWAIGAGVVLLAIAAVGVASRFGVEPSSRCPDGAVPIGARCCFEGQSLESGMCTGTPTRCPEHLRRHAGDVQCFTDQTIRTRVEGGDLETRMVDWEAAGRTDPPHGRVETFMIDKFEVTEARWAGCEKAELCPHTALGEERWLPVRNISSAAAEGFCKFVGGHLPTPEQHALAGAGLEGRRYPWGNTGAVCRRAAFGLEHGPCAEAATGPDAIGMRPDGATPTGVHDLSGNVAEWAVDSRGKVWIRGGSYKSTSAAALRTWSMTPSNGDPAADVGFRCAYSFE
ncbi:MAG: SUMF1/EgtB/PvdO family nonheme iron enzyme [Polyangiaceae bacterium]|nr:SUMF1/EgtB/PvdO family nonheme iron enzyme [Polyangiaceae bacterium]